MEATSTLTPSAFNTDSAAFFAAFAIRFASDAVVSANSGHMPHLAWLQCGLEEKKGKVQRHK